MQVKILFLNGILQLGFEHEELAFDIEDPAAYRLFFRNNVLKCFIQWRLFEKKQTKNQILGHLKICRFCFVQISSKGAK